MAARVSGRRSSQDPWDALHARLRGALVNAFAAVGEGELGPDLRALLDACLQAAGENRELARYRKDLEQFDRLGRQDRSVLVARGVRLCATHRPKADEPPSKSSRAKRGAKKSSARMKAAAAEQLPEAAPVALVEPAPESASVRTLPGVGPATAGKLEARGLCTIVDLVYVLPTGYEDRRQRKSLDEIEEGEIAVLEAEVGSLRQGFGRGRFMATLQLRVDEDGRKVPVTARWFHRVGGLERWAKGGRVLAIGALRRYQGSWSMAHPELRDPAEPGPAIGVRYPSVEGIAPRTLARLIGKALDEVGQPGRGFSDALPPDIAHARGLPDQLQALRALHRPGDDLPEEAVRELCDGASPAHRRLAFDEFFFFQLALLRIRQRFRAQPAALRVDEAAFDREKIRACLPFEPTGAQWRVLEEIEEDMDQGPPMLRLLQGDVGSGKTAVAFATAMAVASAGGQVALMAPTEILAEQHGRTLRPWCEAAGLSMALLTGATPRAERNSLLSLLAAGRIDLLVGTHALITQDVAFAELGLVIIDEQHRFGVEQRALLRQKGRMPHLLVMTATPIPRTMALCAHGELEVSVIDELPPGREPAQTFLFTGKRGLDRVRRGIAKRVRAGDRAFVVCPLVEKSDVLDVTDVEATAAAIRALLPEVEVGVVHGRMSSKDKDAVMSDFRSGRSAVLVATSVIEVGVDVPDARVMAVEHAERFGLAQLHQLRGRVGRGGGQSYCLLHTASGPSSDVAKRLSILTETSDGFVVAERDLALRGPGEVFGTRQSGAPRLRFAGFGGEGTRLLVQAREAAQELLQADPDLRAHPEVLAELRRRGAGEAVVAAGAG